MVKTHEYEVCSDPRAKTCLMCTDGKFCNGLSDTDDCKFYKDKRTMSDLQLSEYRDELWRDGYRGCTLAESGRLARIGQRIREGIEKDAKDN